MWTTYWSQTVVPACNAAALYKLCVRNHTTACCKLHTKQLKGPSCLALVAIVQQMQAADAKSKLDMEKMRQGFVMQLKAIHEHFNEVQPGRSARLSLSCLPLHPSRTCYVDHVTARRFVFM